MSHISKILTIIDHATRLMSEPVSSPRPSLTSGKGVIRKGNITTKELAPLRIEPKHDDINPWIWRKVSISRSDVRVSRPLIYK